MWSKESILRECKILVVISNEDVFADFYHKCTHLYTYTHIYKCVRSCIFLQSYFQTCM